MTLVGWIPGLEIDWTSFHERFLISKNKNWFSKLCWFWGYQNFGPIPWKFDFGIFRTFSASSRGNVIGNKRWGIFLRIFQSIFAKLVGRCPPTQTPTQMLKRGCSIFSSQGIGSRLVSFQMIFEALQSELFRFNFHSLSQSKNSRNST